MGVYYLQDCKLWIAQYDLSARSNKCEIGVSVAELDVTSFASGGWTEDVAGRESIDLSHAGFWEGGVGNVDDALFARLGGAGVALTAAPTDGADGEPAFFFQAFHTAYRPGGDAGEVFSFEAAAAAASSRLVKGTILHPKTARSSSANGTARQLGAVSATQKLYAALHVFAVSGAAPTLDVKVQSDNGVGFGTPADQITFAQATAAGAQFAPPVAGAITDDWWRITYAIGGGTPSFTFAVAVGIR